ncbi:MAG: triphosphoribosyl-dephospho-CoA synthase [Methylophilaceae bacterium]
MVARVDEITKSIGNAYKAACLAELEALKPGNVHIFADGHGMTIDHFIKSAEATAPVISMPDLTVGQRIYLAVEATQQVVGLNTNLGIILLCAPLIQAAWHDNGNLHQTLQSVLKNLTVDDAQLAAKAIQLAKPGGLGHADLHDINALPQVTLLTMMQAAESRDRIAWQYAHDFLDVFEFGQMKYQNAMNKFQNQAWATSALYLAYLAKYPDTHVARKHGEALALAVMLEAQEVEKHYWLTDYPKLMQQQLLNWDSKLKQGQLNPGTSADLTVVTIFLTKLVNLLNIN